MKPVIITENKFISLWPPYVEIYKQTKSSYSIKIKGWCWKCFRITNFTWCEEHYFHNRFGIFNIRRIFCCRKKHPREVEYEYGEMGSILSSWCVCDKCENWNNLLWI